MSGQEALSPRRAASGTPNDEYERLAKSRAGLVCSILYLRPITRHGHDPLSLDE
jgi:hypothetical protein